MVWRHMLEKKHGLVENVISILVALLEGDGLVEAEPGLAGDVVDGAGEQVGLESGGIFDRLDDDALDPRLSPHQVGFSSSTIWAPARCS